MLDVRVDLALYPDILRRRLASLSVLANSSTLSSSESLHIQPLESRNACTCHVDSKQSYLHSSRNIQPLESRISAT